MKNYSLTRLNKLAYFLKGPKYSTNETVTVTKGDKTAVYPASVIRVADALMAANVEINTMKRATAQAWAEHVLNGAPAPAAVQVDEPEETPRVTAHMSVSNAAGDQASGADTTAPMLQLPVRIAIYTLLVSALELTKFDKKSGAEALASSLEKVSVAYLGTINQTVAVPTQVESTPENDAAAQDPQSEVLAAAEVRHIPNMTTESASVPDPS